jgi:hypothetical protein
VAIRHLLQPGIEAFPGVCFYNCADNLAVMSCDYQLVHLNNGICSVRSLADAETFHPVVGPVAEAESLYVNQLRLRERLARHTGEFVIWDVGLGAAANALTGLRATRDVAGRIRLVSFDHTLEPLKFALRHAADLGYFGGYEHHLEKLLRTHEVAFQDGSLSVDWNIHLGDFPIWLNSFNLGRASSVSGQEHSHAARGDGRPTSQSSAPHAIFFDAYSPAKNPAMWTLPVFENLFRALDPQRPCALTTYSRSTIIRATLLLAGFYVGAGHATGMKEETTIAANTLDLIAEPLGKRWLERAMRSDSAEPLREPLYSRARLAPETAEKLRRHPQFSN